MEPVNWNNVFNLIQIFGLPLIILWLGARGKWVFERHFRAMEQDRDSWKSIALRNIDQAEGSTDLADQSVRTLHRAVQAVLKAEGDSR